MTTKSPLVPLGSNVCPGDRLGRARHFKSGPGTHVKGGLVFSSLVGIISMEKDPQPTIRVDRSSNHNAVLSVGQAVLCRILRISTQQAVVEIVAFDAALSEPAVTEGGTRLPQFRPIAAFASATLPNGVIRKEDIRSGASEDVEVYSSFLPGDIVHAKILSLGDSRRYFLTTCEPELGVIRAICSSSGKHMVPLSWKEMQCPETKAKELRKCAKPVTISP